MHTHASNILTYVASTDLAKRVRVKMCGTKVCLSGLGETDVGVTEYAVKQDELVAVRPKNTSGFHEMTADAQAIEKGTLLYAAAGGCVSPIEADIPIGYAIETSTGIGGELIAVQRI